MFDKYLIDADSLRDIGPADAPDGFAFDAKLGYYRGHRPLDDRGTGDLASMARSCRARRCASTMGTGP